MTRIVVVLTVLVAACSGSGSASPPDSTAAPEAASTTTPTTTTQPTTSTSTTTSTTPPTPLERLGYPVSDDWVVETVVADIDAGAGGLAVDDEGIFYLGDFGYPDHPGEAVWRILPDGTAEPWATSDSMQTLTMTTFGADGWLYQSSYGTDRVFRISPDGVPEVVAEDVAGATGLVVDEDGTIFVEAFDRNQLLAITPDGEREVFAAGAGFNGINGLDRGPDGTLYVANYRDGRLLAVDREGTISELHRFPRELAHVAHLDGSLFVTARTKYVIYRYDLETGDVEIVAGNAEHGDSDGRGSAASFGSPNAITVGPDGHLYFNHAKDVGTATVTIRRLSYQPEG